MSRCVMSCVHQASIPTTTSMTPSVKPAPEPSMPPVTAAMAPISESESGTILKAELDVPGLTLFSHK